MDPSTLALVGLASLIALGIKHAARPPVSAPQPEIETEPVYPSALPPRLAGGGLRPAVTQREDDVEEVTERLLKRETFFIGKQALETGVPADVAGATSSQRGSTTTTTTRYGGGGGLAVEGSKLPGPTINTGTFSPST